MVASWEGVALVALKSYKHNGAPSLSLQLLSIVASGEGGGRLNPIKIMAPPLSVIKIVKYCGVVGGALMALKSYKHNGAPSLSLILLSIVASGDGGGALAGAKILQNIMTPIKINKYCGVGGVCVGGGIGEALKFYKR